MTGFRVVVSPHLPILPSAAEDVRRTVRHRLANVLEWLGEEVGPKPGEATHALYSVGTVYVSQELSDNLARSMVQAFSIAGPR